MRNLRRKSKSSRNSRVVEHYLAEHTEEGAQLISERINDLFPFGDQELEAAIISEESSLVVLLPDSFSVALRHGYEELLFERPDDLEGNWAFRVVPYVKSKSNGEAR